MIENLVSMGLPEEWAIRAAQQTDVSASETAAITWIIERMELEQSGRGGNAGYVGFFCCKLIFLLHKYTNLICPVFTYFKVVLRKKMKSSRMPNKIWIIS